MGRWASAKSFGVSCRGCALGWSNWSARTRIFDERTDLAPRVPARHEGRDGEHVHGVISAPMQGTILEVLVDIGQRIQAGDVVCILEAMKMENHIASTREGEITDLPIRAGQVVELGALLAVID